MKHPQPQTFERTQSSLLHNLETEINKIKLQISLVDLLKNKTFKDPIMKILQPDQNTIATDTISLQDDKPAIFLGQSVSNKDENVPPFYVSLDIHEKVLHNCLLDSGASHNLMPKVIMDKLGLEVTKPYHDLYTFDSRRVKCLGVIKDLAVTLTQLPMKNVLMDIVVADIEPKFGLLLSRLWSKRLGGTLQMDFSYATIPMFCGKSMRLYRETQLAYMISDPQNPTNHPLYAVQNDMDSFVLHMDGDHTKPTLEQPKPIEAKLGNGNDCLWKMLFDGSQSKEGSRDGIVIISPSN